MKHRVIFALVFVGPLSGACFSRFCRIIVQSECVQLTSFASMVVFSSKFNMLVCLSADALADIKDLRSAQGIECKHAVDRVGSYSGQLQA